MKVPLKKTATIVIIIIASISIILGLPYALANGTKLFFTIKIFTQVLDLVKRYHVDQVDEETLMKAAIEGMLSRSDPYSSLLVGNELQQWQQELQNDAFSITDASIIRRDIGYLKINSFSSTTGEEFKTCLLRLQRHGMQKLIIDLRGNCGGYLRAAVDVCDQLLPEGKKIVAIKGRQPGFNQVYFSTAKEKLNLSPLIILIDSVTASAAEIVAGAMQDLDRAVIIGHQSAGKGTVQNQFQLSDSLALLLSTARYILPSGRSIQRNYNSGAMNYQNDRYIIYPDSATKKIAPSPPLFFTDAGRPVFAGQGIIPDIRLDGYSGSLDSLFHFDLRDQSISMTLLEKNTNAPFQNHDLPLRLAIHHFECVQQFVSHPAPLPGRSQ